MEKDNIINQANQVIQLKESLKEVQAVIPTLVSLFKTVYDEMITQGFTPDQSLIFASQYTLKIAFPEDK